MKVKQENDRLKLENKHIQKELANYQRLFGKENVSPMSDGHPVRVSVDFSYSPDAYTCPVRQCFYIQLITLVLLCCRTFMLYLTTWTALCQ